MHKVTLSKTIKFKREYHKVGTTLEVSKEEFQGLQFAGVLSSFEEPKQQRQSRKNKEDEQEKGD